MTTKYSIDIRYIAISTMLIDHIGLFFFPDQLIFRAIGRFAFPLFAWGMAIGARYTRNISRYLFRLSILAGISQITWYLASLVSPLPFPRLNVVFTLIFGLLAIELYKSKLSIFLKLPTIYLLLYFSNLFDMDYQASGVLSVLFSYIFYTNFAPLLISQVIFFCYPYFFGFLLKIAGYQVSYNNYLSLLAPLAFFLTRLPQNRPTIKSKYLFYVVYPLQFLVFYLLKVI